MASGIGVSGRLASGVVQVGEKLRILPGDETAVVRSGSALGPGAEIWVD